MSNRQVIGKYIGRAKIDEIIPHTNRASEIALKGPNGLNIRGRMYVDSNVGIGTEYPNNMLDIVNGGIDIHGNDTIDNTFLLNVSNTSNLNTLIVRNNGRIGIGTDNPSTILEIQGTDALRVPVGNISNRPNEGKLGYIRYNNELNSYEAYGAGDAWGSLGGSIDIDKDTRIEVENEEIITNQNITYNTDYTITLDTNNNQKTNLFDNDLSTNWESTTTSSNIIFDLLNNKKKLKEIKLYTRSLYSNNNISKIKLQSSNDNINYNDINNSEITIVQTNNTLIPIFTNNNTPTQIYTDYLSGFTSDRLYKVFDNSDNATDSPAYFERTSGNNIVNRYVGYNFGTSTCVNKYLVQTGWNGGQNDTLKKWKFQGSNDGLTWDDIDSQDNYTNTIWLNLNNFTKIIELPNPVNYIHYRWFIQENNNHPYCGVSSLKVFTYNWEDATTQVQGLTAQLYAENFINTYGGQIIVYNGGNNTNITTALNDILKDPNKDGYAFILPTGTYTLDITYGNNSYTSNGNNNYNYGGGFGTSQWFSFEGRNVLVIGELDVIITLGNDPGRRDAYLFLGMYSQGSDNPGLQTKSLTLYNLTLQWNNDSPTSRDTKYKTALHAWGPITVNVTNCIIDLSSCGRVSWLYDNSNRENNIKWTNCTIYTNSSINWDSSYSGYNNSIEVTKCISDIVPDNDSKVTYINCINSATISNNYSYTENNIGHLLNNEVINAITQKYLIYNTWDKIFTRYYKLQILSAFNNTFNPSTTLLDINYEQKEDDDTIRFYTRNNQRMIISQNGNIGFGIGFNLPSVSLHVNASDAIKIPKGTTAQRPGYLEQGLIRYNTETEQFEGYGAGNAWGSLGGVKDVDRDTYISSELTANADNDQLKFFTEGIERMVIGNSSTSGNIGIGTNEPKCTLHINKRDAIMIPNGTTAERPSHLMRGLIRFNSETEQFEGYGAGDSWGSLGGVIDVNQDTFISAENSATNNNDELKFFTEGTQRMIIGNSTNSGYIGIGTYNPQAVLDIRGNLAVSGNAYFNNGIILGNAVYAQEGAIRLTGDPNDQTKNEIQTFINGEWNSLTKKSFIGEDRLNFENNFYIKFITQTYSNLFTTKSLPAINATNLNNFYTENKLYLNNYVEIHGFDIILFNNENIDPKSYIVKLLINDIDQNISLLGNEFSFNIPQNKSDGLKTLNFSFDKVIKANPDDYISLKIKSTNTTTSECIFHLRGLQHPNERYSIEWHSDQFFKSNVTFSSSLIIANTNTTALAVPGSIRYDGSHDNFYGFTKGGWQNLVKKNNIAQEAASAITADEAFLTNINNTFKNFLFTTNVMPLHLSSQTTTNDYYYVYRSCVFTHIDFLFVNQDTTNKKSFSLKFIVNDIEREIGLDFSKELTFDVPGNFFNGFDKYVLRISQPIILYPSQKLKIQLKHTDNYTNTTSKMYMSGHTDYQYKTPVLLGTEVEITKNLTCSANVNFIGNNPLAGVNFDTLNNTLEINGHVKIGGNLVCSGLILSKSDKNLKKNIEPLNKGINIINELQPKSYLWKDNNLNTPNKKTFGFIAQEVNEIIPDIVHKQNEYYNIEYNAFIPLLIKSIQELSNKVDDIDNKINSRVDQLHKKMNIMDKKIQKIEKNEKNNNLFKLF